MTSSLRSVFVSIVTVAVPLCGACQDGGQIATTRPESSGSVEPAAVRLEVPEEHPNGPFYSVIGISPVTGALRFPHTEEWGAAPFVRELGCVPPDFNLLSLFDLTPAFPGGPPRSFLCAQTVEGHLIFEDAGPPPSGLIQSQMHGLGQVPIVFAPWSEIEAAIADDVLTLPELLALPSAMVGTADFYKETVVTGSLPPGQVAFRLNAKGTLPDGRAFRLLYVDRASVALRTRIVIR